MRQSLATRILAVILNLSLVATSFANPGMAAPVAQLPDFVRTLTPPVRLGYLDSYYQGTTQKPVILIQDLHANYGVQKKIIDLLQYLQPKVSPVGHPMTIGEEAAWAPVDVSYMRQADPRVKSVVGDFLLKEAEINGVEQFAVLSKQPVNVMGIDNQDDYLMHRELIRRSAVSRLKLAYKVDQLRAALADSKKQASRAIKKVWDAEKAFRAGEIDLSELARELQVPALANYGAAESALDQKKTELAEQSGDKAFFLKNIVRADQDLDLLSRLLRQQLTLEEVQFVTRKVPEILVVVAGLLPGQNRAEWKDTIQEAIDYYAIALMRNRPLAENTLRLVRDDGDRPHVNKGPVPSAPSTVVVVTGGFHTAGIAQALKAHQISYVVLTPVVESHTNADEILYLRRMLGEHVTDEDMTSYASTLKVTAHTAAIRTFVAERAPETYYRAIAFFSNILSGKREIATGGNLLPLEDGKVWYVGPVVKYTAIGDQGDLRSLVDSRPGKFSAGNMFSDVYVHQRAFRGIRSGPDDAILRELVEFSKRDYLVTASHTSGPYEYEGPKREILYTTDGEHYSPLAGVLKTGVPEGDYAIYPAAVDWKERVVVSPEKFLVESVSEFDLLSDGQLRSVSVVDRDIHDLLGSAVGALDSDWAKVHKNLVRAGFRPEGIRIKVEVAKHRYAEETYFDPRSNTVTIKITPSDDRVLQMLKILKGVTNLAHTPKEVINQTSGTGSEVFTLYPFIKAALGWCGYQAIVDALDTVGINTPLWRLFNEINYRMWDDYRQDRVSYHVNKQQNQKRWIADNHLFVYGKILEFLMLSPVFKMLNESQTGHLLPVPVGIRPEPEEEPEKDPSKMSEGELEAAINQITFEVDHAQFFGHPLHLQSQIVQTAPERLAALRTEQRIRRQAKQSQDRLTMPIRTKKFGNPLRAIHFNEIVEAAKDEDKARELGVKTFPRTNQKTTIRAYLLDLLDKDRLVYGLSTSDIKNIQTAYGDDADRFDFSKYEEKLSRHSIGEQDQWLVGRVRKNGPFVFRPENGSLDRWQPFKWKAAPTRQDTALRQQVETELDQALQALGETRADLPDDLWIEARAFHDFPGEKDLDTNTLIFDRGYATNIGVWIQELSNVFFIRRHEQIHFRNSLMVWVQRVGEAAVREGLEILGASKIVIELFEKASRIRREMGESRDGSSLRSLLMTAVSAQLLLDRGPAEYDGRDRQTFPVRLGDDLLLNLIDDIAEQEKIVEQAKEKLHIAIIRQRQFEKAYQRNFQGYKDEEIAGLSWNAINSARNRTELQLRTRRSNLKAAEQKLKDLETRRNALQKEMKPEPAKPRDLMPIKMRAYKTFKRKSLWLPALRDHIWLPGVKDSQSYMEDFLITKILQTGTAYTGFRRKDIEYVMNRIITYPQYEAVFRIYSHVYQQFLPLSPQLLKEYDGNTVFVLRRGLKSQNDFEFIPQPDFNFNLTIDDYGDYNGAGQDKPAYNQIYIAAENAFAAMKTSSRDYGNDLLNLGLSQVKFVIDPALDAPEETFIAYPIDTPMDEPEGHAEIHFSPRLLEPGIEPALLGAVIKGLVNVTTKVDEGEVKEVKTIPPFLTHWVATIGVKAVKTALSTLGETANPLAGVLDSVVQLIDEDLEHSGPSLDTHSFAHQAGLIADWFEYHDNVARFLIEGMLWEINKLYPHFLYAYDPQSGLDSTVMRDLMMVPLAMSPEFPKDLGSMTIDEIDAEMAELEKEPGVQSAIKLGKANPVSQEAYHRYLQLLREKIQKSKPKRISKEAPRDLMPAPFVAYQPINTRWKLWRLKGGLLGRISVSEKLIKQIINGVQLDGEAYSGFQKKDILKMARWNLATFRIYDTSQEDWRPVVGDLKSINENTTFILRNSLDNPDILEFVPAPRLNSVEIQKGESHADNTGPLTPEFMEHIYQIESLSPQSLYQTTDFRIIRISFDPNLDAPEETFIDQEMKTAEIRLNPRLAELGFEDALVGAVIKGLVNVSTKVNNDRYKEFHTLPVLFEHWSTVVGVFAVKSALKTLGPGAVPLSNLFEHITTLADERYREEAAQDISGRQALKRWLHGRAEVTAHLIKGMLWDVEQLNPVFLHSRLGTKTRDLFPAPMNRNFRSESQETPAPEQIQRVAKTVNMTRDAGTSELSTMETLSTEAAALLKLQNPKVAVQERIRFKKARQILFNAGQALVRGAA